jgi:hypothetical protein
MKIQTQPRNYPDIGRIVNAYDASGINHNYIIGEKEVVELEDINGKSPFNDYFTVTPQGPMIYTFKQGSRETADLQNAPFIIKNSVFVDAEDYATVAREYNITSEQVLEFERLFKSFKK